MRETKEILKLERDREKEMAKIEKEREKELSRMEKDREKEIKIWEKERQRAERILDVSKWETWDIDMRHFFRSAEEHPEPVACKIHGNVPDWLSGVFVRIGPGKFDLGDFTMSHWFDGYAILYNFTIKDKKVIYRCRYLQSDAYLRAVSVQRPVFTEFGTKAYPDPCKNVFARLFSKLVPTDLTDNDMVNVYNLHDEIYCATESCHIRRIEPRSLDTLEKIDVNKAVGVNIATAHPHRVADGTTYNMGSSFLAATPKYHIIKMPKPSTKPELRDPSGTHAFDEVQIMTTVPCRWKTSFAYFHSFGMSEHYFLFAEMPVCVNMGRLVTMGVKGRALKDCLEFKHEEKTRFIVIEKETGLVSKVTYEADAFFQFHHINTFEQDGFLVCDMITYHSTEIIEKFYLTRLRNNLYSCQDNPRAQRFVLPLGRNVDGPIGTNLVTLKTTTATAERQPDGSIYVTPENMAEPGFELPQINYKAVNGKKYTYVYGSGCFEKGFFSNSTCKINMDTKEVKLYRHCNFCFPGEPIFVPRPGATEEDDGVILSVAIDARPEVPDFMVILDAKTMTEIARCEPPTNIPALLHGCFVPQETLDKYT